MHYLGGLMHNDVLLLARAERCSTWLCGNAQMKYARWHIPWGGLQRMKVHPPAVAGRG